MKKGLRAVGLAMLAASALAAEQAPARKPLDFSHVGVYGTLFPFSDFSVYKILYFGELAKPERLPRYRTMLHEAAA